MKYLIAYLIVFLLFGCVERHKPDREYSLGGGGIAVRSRNPRGIPFRHGIIDSLGNITFDKDTTWVKDESIPKEDAVDQYTPQIHDPMPIVPFQNDSAK